MHEYEHFDAEWQGIKKLTYLMQKVEKNLSKGKNILQDKLLPLTIPEVVSVPV